MKAVIEARPVEIIARAPSRLAVSSITPPDITNGPRAGVNDTAGDNDNDAYVMISAMLMPLHGAD